MADLMGALALSLESPVLLFGHFTYFLLILSMLMRDIAWLRALAITSGVAKIVYREYFVPDPVSVLWETIFVLVNVGQLALIWWENRDRPISDEARAFLTAFQPALRPAAANTLLDAGVWVDMSPGATLTREGKPVNALLFISSGQVRIESGGRVVATCSAGDFLGEMTWQSGAPATGTATAASDVRLLWFERARLEGAMRARPELRAALHTRFNHNLIDKLIRSNQMASAKT